MRSMIGRFFAYFVAGFAVVGLGIAEIIPVWIGLVGFVVLVLIGVGTMVNSIRRIRKGYPALMQMPEAVRGTAEIIEAHETNMLAYMGEAKGYAPRTYALDLRVSLPDRPVYETRHHTAAHEWAIAHLMPGNKLPVYVHPKKPNRMHVDFDSVRGPAGTPTVGDGTTDHSADIVRRVTGMDLKSIVKSAGASGDVVRNVTGMDLSELIEKAVTEGRRNPDGSFTLEQTPKVTIDVPQHVTVTNTRLDLAESGVDGTATVRAVRELGFTSAVGPIVELDLEVTVPGQPSNRVSQRVEMPADSIPRAGDELAVRVDPSSPGRVLVAGESGVSW